MARWLVVTAVAMVARGAAAQPGPSRPFTVEEARAQGDRIARDEKLAASPERDARERVHAARDRADAIEELLRVVIAPVAGGPSAIEAGAERELKARTGLSFDDLRPGSAPAWRRCVEVVRSLHVPGEDASVCLRHAALETPGIGVALGAFALASVELATGDYDGAIARLQPLRGDYDVDLTLAVAVAGQGRTADADARLSEIIRREPARPEAHFDRALLAASRRYESEKPAWVKAQDRRAFVHFRAFLCTREGARLRAPDDAWLVAARGAEDAERRLTGGTHWSWRSEAARPRPFLPQSLLPPVMRDGAGPGPKPSSTCEQVMREARRGD